MESLRYRNLGQGLEKLSPALRNYVSEALSFDAGPEALSGLRSHAREALLETLPLGRSESWKYTDLRRYFAKPTRLADAPGVVTQQDIGRLGKHPRQSGPQQKARGGSCLCNKFHLA